MRYPSGPGTGNWTALEIYNAKWTATDGAGQAVGEGSKISGVTRYLPEEDWLPPGTRSPFTFNGSTLRVTTRNETHTFSRVGN
jgi:hypothetical protein